MPSWSAEQYLLFEEERTRPCRDLVAAVQVSAPRRIVDLGCGPGNSTEVLAARWPGAELAGLDSSAAMIRRARERAPERTWVCADIDGWAPAAPYDLVFSNAALHWLDHHEQLFPRLFGHVAPHGALAVQMPNNQAAPAHAAMRSLAAAAEFRAAFSEPVREWHAHPPRFYYDLLAPLAARIDIWETEYYHVLPSAASIADWYQGSGLRPYLDRLTDPGHRAGFLEAFLEAMRIAYPAQADGRVLLPFRRLFLVAYRA